MKLSDVPHILDVLADIERDQRVKVTDFIHTDTGFTLTIRRGAAVCVVNVPRSVIDAGTVRAYVTGCVQDKLGGVE